MGIYAVTGAPHEGRDGRIGIGSALRQQLLADGHEVISIDRRDADVVCDLATEAGRQAAIDGIRARAADGLDGIATIAATGSGLVDNATLAQVNFFGTIELVEGVRDLLKQTRGSVVLCSSHTFVLFQKEELVDAFLTRDRATIDAAVEKRSGMATYASGKKALVLWMRQQLASYAADGIRLNALVPGYTDTPLTGGALGSAENRKFAEEFQASIPIGQRPGRPEEVAAGAKFLLGPEASFVCGVTLFVDGGHDSALRPDAREFSA